MGGFPQGNQQKADWGAISEKVLPNAVFLSCAASRVKIWNSKLVPGNCVDEAVLELANV